MKYQESTSVAFSAVAWIVPVLVFLVAGSAHAFVGQIAVGLGRMNDVGEVETSFSADAKLETEELVVDTRVYYKPGKVRDEMTIGGQKMITIHRFDLEKIWMIMAPGMYMETKVGQGGDQAPDVTLLSREIVGSETVNGMETTKYKSVYESKDGKFGGFTWYTDDNIAVKAFLVHQSKGEKQRIKFELKNLVRAPQPDSLFEVPKGARKLDLMGLPGMPNMDEMMKMGPGGRSGQGMPGMPGMPSH